MNEDLELEKRKAKRSKMSKESKKLAAGMHNFYHRLKCDADHRCENLSRKRQEQKQKAGHELERSLSAELKKKYSAASPLPKINKIVSQLSLNKTIDAPE